MHVNKPPHMQMQACTPLASLSPLCYQTLQLKPCSPNAHSLKRGERKES
jgi:hypothetical protein